MRCRLSRKRSSHLRRQKLKQQSSRCALFAATCTTGHLVLVAQSRVLKRISGAPVEYCDQYSNGNTAVSMCLCQCRHTQQGQPAQAAYSNSRLLHSFTAEINRKGYTQRLKHYTTHGHRSISNSCAQPHLDLVLCATMKHWRGIARSHCTFFTPRLDSHSIHTF
jgi:hypothetical protein